MPQTLLSLPRELRDRIYHFAFEDAHCVGRAGKSLYLVAYSPERDHPRIHAKWTFANKQIFKEARVQFCREAWIRFMNISIRSLDVRTGPFTFCPDIAQMSRWSTVCKISDKYLRLFESKQHYPPKLFFAQSTFRKDHRDDWDYKSSIAPSITRLRIVATMLPNLGHLLGTEQYTSCVLLPETTFVSGMSFHAVEIILPCPLFQYRKFEGVGLAGVMRMYEKIQEGLEAAAIELTGLPHSTGKTIRDWVTDGSDNLSQRWHIEVCRTGKSGDNTRRVEHLGMQSWTDPCDACGQSELKKRCTGDPSARRFKIVEPKKGEDIRFFCSTTNETVQRVDGQFEIQQHT